MSLRSTEKQQVYDALYEEVLPAPNAPQREKDFSARVYSLFVRSGLPKETLAKVSPHSHHPDPFCILPILSIIIIICMNDVVFYFAD